MPTLHEVQENMRKLVEQDYRNAEIRRVYARHLLNEAAPKMLEALEEVLPQIRWANIHGSRCEELIVQVESVIAKAKG